MDNFDEELRKDIERGSQDPDYSDPAVVVGNLQALESAFVRLLYNLRAKEYLADGEAGYILGYNVAGAESTPELGPAHGVSYQLSLFRMRQLLEILRTAFPIDDSHPTNS